MSKVDSDPKHLVSRKEACEILGLSKSGLRYLEGVHLHPIMIEKKVFYQRGQVDSVLVEKNGESASVAFQSFREGKSQIDVVIETAMSPKLVQSFYEMFLRMLDKEKRTVVLSLPSNLDKEAWLNSLGFDGELTFEKLQAALELAARVQSFRGSIGLDTDVG